MRFQCLTAILLLQALPVISRVVPSHTLVSRQIQDPIDPSNMVTTNTTATTTAAPTPNSPSSSAALPRSPRPRNHNIAVGQNGSLFTPSTLKTIPVGDSLTFYFYPSNYSLVQSSFLQPCQPLSAQEANSEKHTHTTPIFSGFNPTADGHTIARQKFIVNVTSAAAPLWIYAVDGTLGTRRAAACEAGMVLVVNPRVGDGQTLAAYRKAAAAARNGKNVNAQTDVDLLPDAIVGGDVKGVSDKEMVRWLSRHPVGGDVDVAAGSAVGTNGTSAEVRSSNDDDAAATGVTTFESSAVISGQGNSLMAVAVLVGTWAFGFEV